jgi:acylglycerol lipase
MLRRILIFTFFFLAFIGRYAGKPRLGTVIELLKVTANLEETLKDVSLPFIVLHGDADVVTEPAVSTYLYETARSEDKTLRIYEGMQHSLIQGEPDENVAIILNDISTWLKVRVRRKMTSQGEQNNPAQRT